MSVTTLPPNETSGADAPGGDGKKPKKGGKKKLLILLVLLVVVVGAGWFFFLKPTGPPPQPVPGETVALESIQLNLEGGHYLRLGMALELSADVTEEIDGSKALDSAIDLFSGREMSEVNTGKQRQDLKAELLKRLEEAYEHEVLDVYFTEFVTQ
ncbi:flagellar basal body-associated FliL family protein [Nocardioides sp. InS609-2]|uniref:flagellar basal body-associated FliL family protein n=1 Tax=Nocardioides sp. InS609-2 TaxID=2760705 RepID=UPI0020BEDD06|nr:flagellar basal body-associated FliL family protein [Nocardioides sp. InS609-2]